MNIMGASGPLAFLREKAEEKKGGRVFRYLKCLLHRKKQSLHRLLNVLRCRH